MLRWAPLLLIAVANQLAGCGDDNADNMAGDGDGQQADSGSMPMGVAAVAGSSGLANDSMDARDAASQQSDASTTQQPAADASTGNSGTGICTSCADCEETLSIDGAAHVDTPAAEMLVPPAGGEHNPCWANYQEYTEPLPSENWTHNLEHGAVVFLYNCPDGCESDLAELRTLHENSERSILTGYPSMTARFAVVSWGHRLVSECFDAQAFSDFYSAYFDMGPESISSGAPTGC